MKKIFICVLIATSFIAQATEKPKEIETDKSKKDGTCTVTVGRVGPNGACSSSATAPTCAAAEKEALSKLTC